MKDKTIVIDDIGQIYNPINDELDKLISDLKLKIKNQGMITNARDEIFLASLIKERENQ